MIRFWRRWLPREDWNEELQSHIEMRSEWNRERLGLTPEASTELAQRQFGSTLRIRESIEDLHAARLLEDFLHDLKHAVRLFRFSPGLALMVVSTMAAGIAASTTIFSIVDPLLFRRLPFRDAGQLVSVGVEAPVDKNEFAMGAMYAQWRDNQTVFSSLTSMLPGMQCDLELSETKLVPCAAVQSSFLPTLGIAAALGRNFSRSEDQPGAPRTILISDRIWRGDFGSQTDVIGKTVKLDDGPARIAGVLPANFVLPQGADVDVLLPAQLDERKLLNPRMTIVLRVFGRLKPGMSVEGATQRMAPLFESSIQRTVPPEVRREVHPVVRSVRDRITGEAKLPSRLLLGAVALLLLMACLTLTNLLLARAHANRSELAMRAALGASRARLFRQCLTETLLLASAGGAIGFLLSWACVLTLVHVAPGGFLYLDRVHLDKRALAFSGIATLAATLLSGILPALRSPEPPNQSASRVTSLAKLRQVLTSLQIACSLVLLTGALLFTRSLNRLESQPPGFSQDHLTAISLHVPRGPYTTTQLRINFDRQIESKLRSIPGVESVALSDSLPPAGPTLGRPLDNIRVAGITSLPSGGGMVFLRRVSPDYFHTLGIPILRGRTFNREEETQRQTSVVFSQSLAQKLFPAGDALGSRVSLDGGNSWVTVIGIAPDVKNNGLSVPSSPEYYLPRASYRDRLGQTTIAFVRSTVETAALTRWLHKELTTIDPAVTAAVETMPERLHHMTDRPRFIALVLLIFALASILLASSGLYGVISFVVSSRTREIGIRSALGASWPAILLMVQRQTLICAGIGIVIGAIGSLALGDLVRTLLFQISPRDPVLLGGAALCLLAVALLSALEPSWKAAHIHPADALRAE
jgi:predicted permease